MNILFLIIKPEKHHKFKVSILLIFYQKHKVTSIIMVYPTCTCFTFQAMKSFMQKYKKYIFNFLLNNK